ncbi:hypothetical protein [Kitasatospora sp. NPDC089509]|uniref:hypothetical protein n=1 Tax=Kitasatospora sp. NPDC089509 TaxID=3364079 RepID=UPI0037FA1D57
MSDSVPPPLSAAEALRLAERAGAAARRPSPAPRWYGPVIAAGFVVCGIAAGQAIAAHQIWLVSLLGGAWGPLSGLLAWLAARGSGVVQRQSPPGMAGPVVLIVLAVSAAMLGAMALVGWVGGVQWGAAAGGVAGGAVFWAASRALDRRILRLREAG